jgi:hypothetical protein
MPDRSEDFRREAARLLEAARTAKTPESKAEMIRLAEKWLELAGHQSPIDFDAILAEYNDQQMGRPEAAQPVGQQQQQIQSTKKEEC